MAVGNASRGQPPKPTPKPASLQRKPLTPVDAMVTRAASTATAVSGAKRRADTRPRPTPFAAGPPAAGRLRARWLPLLGPLRRNVTAVLTALALVIVGTVSGMAFKKHKEPSSLQAVALGKSKAAKTGKGTDTAKGTADPLSTSTGAPVAKRAPATKVVAVAPLKNRVDPDLFVTSSSSFTPLQIFAASKVANATRLQAVDFAQVKLGKGITSAVGVDPSTFRQYTPDNTAPVNALWQRIAGGDAAVAHAVAVPVIAIGGIPVDTVPMLMAVGAYGVAVVGAVSDASDPARATAELLRAVAR